MSECTRVVHPEVLAASAVRFIAERRGADEAGVLAGGRGDGDIVVSVSPIERRS